MLCFLFYASYFQLFDVYKVITIQTTKEGGYSDKTLKLINLLIVREVENINQNKSVGYA